MTGTTPGGAEGNLEGLRHPSLSTESPYVAPEVSGREPEPYFAGYASRMSVAVGDELGFHVASRSGAECHVDLYRVVGCADAAFTPALELVTRIGPADVARYPSTSDPARLGPGDADSAGCRWPRSTCLARVPENWRSGLYLAQFTGAPEPTGRAARRLGEDALFIVRPRDGEARAELLVQVSVATWAAYHIWRNRSLYMGRTADGKRVDELRAFTASLERPGVGLGLPNETVLTPAPPKASYTFAAIDWLERRGISYDLCAGLDLERDVMALDSYSVLLTVGHDEYWTDGQCRTVQGFRGGGGHTVFLGGNLAYWRIRASIERGEVECYKRASPATADAGFDAEPLDPRYPADRAGPTTERCFAPDGRSTIDLTGVYNEVVVPGSGRSPDEILNGGAMWWWEELGGPSRPPTGFEIVSSGHWIFRGTGVADGDVIGAGNRLVGHEADGLDVEWNRRPRLTFRDGALPGTELLAIADCRDWGEIDYTTTPARRVPGRRASAAAIGGAVTLICHAAPDAGMLVTAPTTEWVFSLVPAIDYPAYRDLQPRVKPALDVTDQITMNVVTHLLSIGRRAVAS